jgi:histone arginine demethylase JMJD6
MTAVNDDDDDNENDNESRASATASRSLFLTSEERYEVFMVKMAERPHLLSSEKDPPNENRTTTGCRQTDDKNDNDNHHQDMGVNDNDDDDDQLPSALIDGCDIPAWRYYGLVPTSSFQECVLGIGSGSSFFRTESQLPMMTSNAGDNQQNNAWQNLKQQLLLPPPASSMADTIDIQHASERVVYHHEDKMTIDPSSQCCQTTRFAATWEVDNRPCVITGCCSENHHQWNTESWTFESLVDRFNDLNWRFSDTHGSVMSLGTYAKYVSSLEGYHDDSPLAIYDSEFGDETSPTHILTRDYQVPTCFSPDLFDLAMNTATISLLKNGNSNDGTSSDDSQDTELSNPLLHTRTVTDEPQCHDSPHSPSRPPYRWILIGPARSGTGMHIDPLHTNAWVTVLQGLKRWMLFPPNTPPDLIGMQDPPLPSVIWFRDYYTKVTRDDWPQLYAPVQVLQFPGDTVFVPNGWPHVVVNLESMTVAVTHNYASEFGPCFDAMVQQTREEEPEFYQSWMQGLQQHRPDLVERILQS